MPDARVVLTHPDGTQEFSHTTVEAILAALARGDGATAARLGARFRITAATTDYERALLGGVVVAAWALSHERPAVFSR